MRGKLATWQISDAEVDGYISQIRERYEDVRQAKVTELPLSVRAYNILHRNFETIGEMLEFRPSLLFLRGFGRTSLAEVEDILKRLGLELPNQFGG
jgi:DNA-directed RNA polymerase alpha subunit